MRDKIAKNGQNWPKFSVFDAKRGTSLKKVHQWWLIWAMQAWGTIKTELRCFTMGRVLLLSCTQPMSSLSSWQQSSSRVIRCRGVSLALRGHLCNYPRKLYKWLLATGWPCVLDGMSGIRGRSLFVQNMFKTFTYKQIRKDPQNSTQTYDGCPPIQNVELASPDSGEVRADVDQIILHPDFEVRKRNFMFFCPKIMPISILVFNSWQRRCCDQAEKPRSDGL